MKTRRIIIPIFFLVLIIIIGTLGYIWTEELSWSDAAWLTIVSVLTIGYGDIAPITPQGKIFTLIIIPIAIGLVTYILAQFASSVIDGNLARGVKKRVMDKKIMQLNDHIIICGYGRVGGQVVTQLKSENKALVMIEKDKEVTESLPNNFLYVVGNAKEEQTLVDAGVNNASAIILTSPNDADNVFITLTTKGINPHILVISRAESDHSEKILYQAGVDRVINTSNIGGKRMAMSVLKPHSVEYIDTLLHNDDVAFSVEEIKVSENSRLTNLSLKEAQIRGLYGVSIVAIKRNGHVISNPNADERLLENDMIIVFGSEHQLKTFEDII